MSRKLHDAIFWRIWVSDDAPINVKLFAIFTEQCLSQQKQQQQQQQQQKQKQQQQQKISDPCDRPGPEFAAIVAKRSTCGFYQ